jgi:hypothetical protein
MRLRRSTSRSLGQKSRRCRGSLDISDMSSILERIYIVCVDTFVREPILYVVIEIGSTKSDHPIPSFLLS